MEQLDLFGVPIQQKEEKKHILRKPAIITIDEPEDIKQPEENQPADLVPQSNIEEDSVTEPQPEIAEPIELSIEENITEQEPEIIEPQVSIEEPENTFKETLPDEQELKDFANDDENEFYVAEDEQQNFGNETWSEKDEVAEQEPSENADENIIDTKTIEEDDKIALINNENDLAEQELSTGNDENEQPVVEKENELNADVFIEKNDLTEQEISDHKHEDDNNQDAEVKNEENDLAEQQAEHEAYETETSMTEDKAAEFNTVNDNEKDDVSEPEINDAEDEFIEENDVIEDEIIEDAETLKPEQPKAPAYKLSPEKIPSKRGRKSLKEINTDVALLDIPEDEELYKKNYYSITEVAEWFRVNPSLLRFWENEFDILKPRKNRKGDRLFRPEDVKNLRIIYYLLRQQKYSIEGAKQFLKDNKQKAEMQTQLVECLTKFRGFLLELRANLGA